MPCACPVKFGGAELVRDDNILFYTASFLRRYLNEDLHICMIITLKHKQEDLPIHTLIPFQFSNI
jgi:hypothetical protein